LLQLTEHPEASQWFSIISGIIFEVSIVAEQCCHRKAQAASAQRFTQWQQTTVKITPRNHSIIACSRHLYMGVSKESIRKFLLNKD